MAAGHSAESGDSDYDHDYDNEDEEAPMKESTKAVIIFGLTVMAVAASTRLFVSRPIQSDTTVPAVEKRLPVVLGHVRAMTFEGAHRGIGERGGQEHRPRVRTHPRCPGRNIRR